MTDPTDIQAQRGQLSRLAAMGSDMAEACYADFKAATDTETKVKLVTAFDLCGRNVRLSILAEMKLYTGVSNAVFAAVANDQRSPRVRTDRDRERDRLTDRESDADRERERDRFPMTPLGRADALAAALKQFPNLDPDGTRTAEVIDIQARLRGEQPPEPPVAPPGRDVAAGDREGHPPANRAERRRLERRMRRASG